ncbi:LexA family transcriptional regulator [Yersinia mollaretii]|uniref:Prophage repressor protein n=1 Tax=Yersinia mollaretii TaxID=33060 RepID=A0AA36PMX2_YERMO|nr:LexA family transcriptional regulator [Yersinia mollaretii]MDA5527317.1 LexA family transcriptional regulator [Yersinia mollaretii]MDA5533645.1 LexA family transcriptional regulator [Yersinia mollaretii]MDR7874643.1 LexA family transcriptional regulator [Yersinia mollaretii]NIL01577.1 LexA family transcriptional regulator [Yersinia mollaretii]PHZ31496.1 peptidase S24 [Yersinia mollaretii]
MKKKPLTPEQLDDAKRLKELFNAKKKALGISQESVAHELGVGQSAVNQFLNGINPLNVTNAAAFAKVLNEPISSFSPSLAKELAKMAESLSISTRSGLKDKPAGSVANSYPLISWISAGSWYEAIEPYSLRDIEIWPESTKNAHDSAFWLSVKGDSMTSPSGISFPEGMIILVDPEKEPMPGNFVIAKLTDDNEATFKKLIVDAGVKYLKPLNPAYRLIELTGNCKIVGVVVDARWLQID